MVGHCAFHLEPANIWPSPRRIFPPFPPSSHQTTPKPHQTTPEHWLPPLQCNLDAVVEAGGATLAQSCPLLRGGAGADPWSRSIPPLACLCVPLRAFFGCMAFWCLAPSSPSHLRCATLSSLLDRTTPQTRGCQNNPVSPASSNRPTLQPSLQSDSERRRTHRAVTVTVVRLQNSHSSAARHSSRCMAPEKSHEP